ncbi:diiron oxygenase [Streptomyces aureoverticillatus]|uniref:diiron oxygenase n=1 Tax=Streptomyces aureoverticillatus TaxID=66871 RepID=UPI0013DB97F5|nr:diiron oxygenase [Streptomyces aureoverticillatus]QIB47729.1 diiron oxygenase [Streptomyces aureoverticillatus]
MDERFVSNFEEDAFGSEVFGAVDNPVIHRLAANWRRRATVKRDDSALLDLFDPALPDYPEEIVPFADHPVYCQLPPQQRESILTWAMIALNRNTEYSETHVVNPAFGLILRGEFPGLWGEALEVSLMQAMVDEQYHILMHRMASDVTRARRGAQYREKELPLPYVSVTHRQLTDRASERWQRSLLTLAFSTTTELSIGAYLELVAGAEGVQPMNVALSRLHRHDEVCHGSISGELLKVLYPQLTDEQQRFLLDALCQALGAYSANDYRAWEAIMRLVGVEGGAEMLQDCRSAGRTALLRDYSGLHQVLAELDVLDRIDFDWSSVKVSGELPYVL